MPATGRPSVRTALSSSASFVLVHGFAQSARSWDAVAKALGADGRCEVVTFELVGHGKRRSLAESNDPVAFDLAAQGEALLGFLEGFEQPPMLVGYSMGGRVALRALANDPERFAASVSALVLESCGLGPATPEERTASAERDAANARRLREQGVSAFMDAWEQLPLFATQQRLPEGVRQRVRDERVANSAETLALTFERAGQHTMPGRAEALAALWRLREQGIPVLYMTGELDGKYSALAVELAANVPAVEARVVPGVGHNVHLEAPDAFCAALRERFGRYSE